MILWLSAAFAGGLHSGIPTTGVPGLGAPRFLTPRSGWTAPAAGGVVKVFVGDTEADAAEWYRRAADSLTLAPSPAAGPGDEAFGDGDGLLAFRDGNVAVMVRVEHGAATLAATLHAAIVDGVPRGAPTLAQAADGTWRVDGPHAGLSAQGGQPVPFQDGAFREVPDTLVVWDTYGRPTVVR